MRTSALFGAKNSGFFEIYGVSVRRRGLSQCGHFSDKGGQFFAILCGHLLWRPLKTKVQILKSKSPKVNYSKLRKFLSSGCGACCWMGKSSNVNFHNQQFFLTQNNTNLIKIKGRIIKANSRWSRTRVEFCQLIASLSVILLQFKLTTF